MPTAIWGLMGRSGSTHCNHALTIEVVWPIAIWSWQLRCGSQGDEEGRRVEGKRGEEEKSSAKV